MTFSEAKAACDAKEGLLTSVDDRYLSKVIGREQNLNAGQLLSCIGVCAGNGLVK